MGAKLFLAHMHVVSRPEQRKLIAQLTKPGPSASEGGSILSGKGKKRKLSTSRAEAK